MNYFIQLILASRTTGRFLLYRQSPFGLYSSIPRWQFPGTNPQGGQTHPTLINNFVRYRGLGDPANIDWKVSRFGYVGWVDEEITPAVTNPQEEEFMWAQMFSLPENLTPLTTAQTKSEDFLRLLSNPW